jgi:hypothetical protein
VVVVVSWNEWLNPEFAVEIYCGLKILAATLVSRFYSLTYLWICLRCKIAPTSRFAAFFCASLRQLLQNLGYKEFIYQRRVSFRDHVHAHGEHHRWKRF